jgi:pyruvate/2-oxoglutarate dehydrogenase complex dihydrolipoamide dehydrogenase (E3) component
MRGAVDAIVVGAGQAGPPLAERLSKAGMSVAVIERDKVGGTCVNTGCMPTKALVASAYAAHIARTGERYGVKLAAPVEVDMKAVKARKDVVSNTARANVEKWIAGMPNCRLYRGHARFESPQAIRVGDDVLTAPRIFLNVGGRAIVPDLPGLSQVSYLTNTSIMDLDVLPRHLVIVGGSYIALEFAQMYRRFGAEVTVLERAERLIAREDPDISAAVQRILEADGVRVLLDVTSLGFAPRANAIAVTAGATEIMASHLLIAIGRVPNTDDLGLDAAGVETDSRGYVKVDGRLRTNVPGIWAMGDCNGRGAFTHTSYNDFEIVAANLLDDDPRSVDDRITTYGLFIDPPLGRVGMTDTEARASGRPLLTAIRPMTRVGRAVEKGETQGFMKVVVDAQTQKILGAAILGVGGDEAVHCITATMYADAPYTVLQRAVHIHPTVSELIPTLLGDLQPAT